MTGGPREGRMTRPGADFVPACLRRVPVFGGSERLALQAQVPAPGLPPAASLALVAALLVLLLLLLALLAGVLAWTKRWLDRDARHKAKVEAQLERLEEALRQLSEDRTVAEEAMRPATGPHPDPTATRPAG